ncbi:hypothetical protein IKD56_01160 [bacterium]|nr:hypothetical protein [bacterium]
MAIAMSIFTIFGTCLLGISIVPQVFYTIKTKLTARLSMMLYLIMGIGTLFLLIYGIGLVIIPNDKPSILNGADWLSSYLIPGIAIIIGELICTSSCFIIVAIKLTNMLNAKKNKLSEIEYEEKFILKKK